MPVNFDYEGNANNIAQMAYQAIPPNIDDNYKQFLAQTIHNFASRAGQALVQEDNTLLTAEKIEKIIHYIAEWSYHKGLELIHSQIPPDHWSQILQAVAAGAYESGRRAMMTNLDDATISTAIQSDVEAHFHQAINKLKEDGALNEQQINSIQDAHKKAQEDIVIEPTPEPQQAGVNLSPKEAKLATVAVILSTLPQEKLKGILQNFTPEEVAIIQSFMQPDNISLNVDPQTTYKLLQSLKNTIAPAEAPNIMAKNIQKLAENSDPTKIFSLLSRERPIVQTYVKACIEGKFIRRDFSPFLAKTILKHLEKQLIVK